MNPAVVTANNLNNIPELAEGGSTDSSSTMSGRKYDIWTTAILVLTASSLLYSIVYYHKSLGKMQKEDRELSDRLSKMESQLNMMNNAVGGNKKRRGAFL
jgi:hypothetical protein